jgi:alkanesulfonate monooxygenase SsuD/methylene tetrahydromethanopterin reductase-like flavin-dependent oxidoreductase (luciferase family)
MAARQLSLKFFVYPGGHHEATWRHRLSVSQDLCDIRYYQDFARKAEAAKFDGLFLADGPTLADNVRYAPRFRCEPTIGLFALAATTESIGLIGTAATTYNGCPRAAIC